MIKINLSNLFGTKKKENVKSLDLVRAETIAQDLISKNYILQSEKGFIFNHDAFRDNFTEFSRLTNELDSSLSRVYKARETVPAQLNQIQETYSIKFNQLEGN
jgi:hypothetical protein